jgi:hypothetical protein
MVYNLDQFELTTGTTYQHYVYASTSNRVNFDKLLPPEDPNVRIRFHFQAIQYRLHRECPGEGLWEGDLRHTFSTFDDAIRELANEKQKYWCQHCSKGLFFPNTCPDPLHLNAYGLIHV